MQAGHDSRRDAAVRLEVDRLWMLWATGLAPKADVLRRAALLLERPQLPAPVRVNLQALVLAARMEGR